MTDPLSAQIDHALGPDGPPRRTVTLTGAADLPSCFAVSRLATASIAAAAGELADLLGARDVVLDRRLASLWFDMTLQPLGWEMPDAWDDIAGVYRASDGWIRLHTNAPHHRAAALTVLDCDGHKAAVAETVAGWTRTGLETAIVAAHGAAAALHTRTDWAAHPQGIAVAQSPLIDWQPTSSGAPATAFDQVKVLDLTRVLAGPVATRFLAGFGAQVLRIDPPWWTEPGVEPEVTLGKARAGLDLRRADDRTIFDALLSTADVLVHGYRPGALAGLGYGPDRLRQLAPQMINISLCAYGWTGPWRQRRGFDSLVQMSTGIAHEGMIRTGADRPVPLPVQALDHATGYLVAAAALRALRQRNQTGQVQSARLSLARTAALLIDDGPRDLHGAALVTTSDDQEDRIEHTGWGDARRVRFPVTVDGRGPIWSRPAGPLRIDAPRWASPDRPATEPF